MPVATASPEIVNCNHGGFYSVSFYSVNRSGEMLGQLRKITPHKWAAWVHGTYMNEHPPVFRSKREAVEMLVAARRQP